LLVGEEFIVPPPPDEAYTAYELHDAATNEKTGFPLVMYSGGHLLGRTVQGEPANIGGDEVDVAGGHCNVAGVGVGESLVSLLTSAVQFISQGTHAGKYLGDGLIEGGHDLHAHSVKTTHRELRELSSLSAHKSVFNQSSR
jgi:hypothetical protein